MFRLAFSMNLVEMVIFFVFFLDFVVNRHLENAIVTLRLLALSCFGLNEELRRLSKRRLGAFSNQQQNERAISDLKCPSLLSQAAEH